MIYNKELLNFLNDKDRYLLVFIIRPKDYPGKMMNFNILEYGENIKKNMENYKKFANKNKCRIYLYLNRMEEYLPNFIETFSHSFHHLYYDLLPQDNKRFTEVLSNEFDYEKYTIDLDQEYLKYENQIIELLKNKEYYIFNSKTGKTILVKSITHEQDLLSLSNQFEGLTLIRGWSANLYIPNFN